MGLNDTSNESDISSGSDGSDGNDKQVIAALLADHVAQAVPDDTDIWPLVQMRLSARMLNAQTGAESGVSRQDLSPLGSRPSISLRAESPQTGARVSGARRLSRSVGAMVAVGLFALVGAIGLLAISGLSRRAGGPQPPNTQTPEACRYDECALLFSIPLGKGDPQRGMGGFGVADDGSFWVGEAGSYSTSNGQPAPSRLLHYNPDGRLLSTITAASRSGALADLEAQGSTIWTLFGDVVRELAPDGKFLAEYYPIMRLPGQQYHMGWYVLRAGGDGQMLLEESSPGGYPNGKFGTYLKAQDWAMNSSPDSLRLVGYPAVGKLYTEGQTPDEIKAGDKPIKIHLPGEVRQWHVMRVLEDGSFYVAVEILAHGVPDVPDGAYNYLLRYDEQGKLLEHARVPALGAQAVLMKQLAIGPDNRLYAIAFGFDYSEGQTSSHADILQLRLSQASETLAALPTPTKTRPIPTDVPTVVMPVAPPPNAVASANAALTPPLQLAQTPSATPSIEATATPLTDLSALTQRAKVILRVHVASSSSARDGLVIHVEAKEWLKRPGDVTSDRLAVWIPEIPNSIPGEVAVPQTFWDPSVTDYVLFLNQSGKKAEDGWSSYELADVTTGAFGIRDGNIDYSGIPGYKGWSVDRFEEAIRSMLSTP